METWVWLDCERHNQLRDLVVSLDGSRGQEEYIQCGCRFKATDPDAALVDLRVYEARRNAEKAARWAAALAPKPPEPIEIPWWAPWLLALICSIGIAVFFMMD